MAAEEEFPALAGGQGVQGRFHKGREFQRTGGEGSGGGIGTCQVHLVLKDKRRQYIWFEKECK